jgi:hypothetical protein
VAKSPKEGEAKFNIHEEFFRLNASEVFKVKLVEEKLPVSSSEEV